MFWKNTSRLLDFFSPQVSCKSFFFLFFFLNKCSTPTLKCVILFKVLHSSLRCYFLLSAHIFPLRMRTFHFWGANLSGIFQKDQKIPFFIRRCQSMKTDCLQRSGVSSTCNLMITSPKAQKCATSLPFHARPSPGTHQRQLIAVEFSGPKGFWSVPVHQSLLTADLGLRLPGGETLRGQKEKTVITTPTHKNQTRYLKGKNW